MQNKKFFFIVGAPKAGTYSLYEIFRQHPEIEMSKVKEPNFFVIAENNSNTMSLIRSKQEYLKQWRRNDASAYGEASPSYLRCPESPALIKESFPDAKIIIIIREPVSRAYSNWKMDVRQGHQKLSFRDALLSDYESRNSAMKIQYEYYKSGLYFNGIKEYISEFGKDNVIIFKFETLVKETPSVVKKILTELGLQSVFDYSTKPENEARLPKSRMLLKAYQSDIAKKYIGRILPEHIRNKLKKIIFSGPKDNTKLTQDEKRYYTQLFIEDIKKTEEITKLDLSNWYHEPN